ncbi:MAG TPA: hypothetical protein VEH84_06390 [Alphaproteobacteria bacterium]|nr:hypothetical protein [Alphaproteobacteria bacterium]
MTAMPRSPSERPASAHCDDEAYGRAARALGIEPDIGRHRRHWRRQKAAWLLLLAFIAAGLGGLFGDGLWGRREIGGGALSLRYDPFARLYTETRILIRAAPPADDPTLRLWIDGGYLRDVEIETIAPTPAEGRAVSDGWVYHWRGEPGRAGELVLTVKPGKPGPIHGKLALPGQPPLEFTQFVYP